MRLAFVLCLLSIAFNSTGQNELKVYTWEELQAIEHNPDTIFSISLRKMRLSELPEALFRYTNLRKLDLSKNQLERLPEQILALKDLQYLDLERNKLDVFPIQFCRMKQLKSLNLGLNAIESLPMCIGEMDGLERLLLYDNPIGTLPEDLTSMKSLKYVDLSGIRFSPNFQEIWIEKMAGKRIDFDAPCDCMK